MPIVIYAHPTLYVYGTFQKRCAQRSAALGPQTGQLHQRPQDGAYRREHEKMMHRNIVKPFNNRTSRTQKVVFFNFETCLLKGFLANSIIFSKKVVFLKK